MPGSLSGRRLEHDDVAAVHVVQLVRELVDEDAVVDLERRHHRLGRDVERLEQERLDQQRDDERAARPGRPTRPPDARPCASWSSRRGARPLRRRRKARPTCRARSRVPRRHPPRHCLAAPSAQLAVFENAAPHSQGRRIGAAPERSGRSSGSPIDARVLPLGIAVEHPSGPTAAATSGARPGATTCASSGPRRTRSRSSHAGSLTASTTSSRAVRAAR